jgi:hypothetical protein
MNTIQDDCAPGGPFSTRQNEFKFKGETWERTSLEEAEGLWSNGRIIAGKFCGANFRYIAGQETDAWSELGAIPVKIKP